MRKTFSCKCKIKKENYFVDEFFFNLYKKNRVKEFFHVEILVKYIYIYQYFIRYSKF